MSWFRYHCDALDNPKIQSLPAALFRFWVNLLCVSQKSSGFLPEISEISFRCRISDKQTKEWIADLKQRGLVDEAEHNELVIHDWNEHQFVSDDVTARVRKHRAKRKRNVSETPPEQNRTDTEQKHKQSAPVSVPPVKVNGVAEFPAILAEMRKHDAAADAMFATRLMTTVVQACLSDPKFPKAELDNITDENVARCVAESYRTGPPGHRIGLLLNRVPAIVKTWAMED